MACQMCLDCLRRRICTDFSDKLVFSYGISDCAYPYGSTAVVQMPNSEGTGASHVFVMLYLPAMEHPCLSRYVDEYCVEGLDKNHERSKDNRTSPVLNQDQVEVSTRIHNDKNSALETISNGQTYLSGLGCKSLTCEYSVRFSCSRIITALAPISQIGISSYPIFEELASNFLCGSLEDHILTSLSFLIEGRATGRDSLNFLSLIGLPSFDKNGFPGCIRHPNLIPVLGILKSQAHINVVMPKAPYTLNNILHFSPSLLKSDWQIRFIIYQLLSALAHLHGLGVAHGNICPKNILLNDSSWCWLNHMAPNLGSSSKVSSAFCYNEGCSSHGIYADLKLTQSVDWHSSFNQWWKGELSNFEYLLVLNKLAGRRWGDYTFHTVMPWVIDFSVKPDENNEAGWRDLSKSKWRLAKGDEQLDFTYSTSEIPHHVSDECLSELAACSYKARRLPLSILRLAVRSVYEPNEYPSTMQRLYMWTPDECIPDFYCNPNIFYSLHSGMSDLAVPSWAGTAEEFIKLHREALESDWVSCRIHNWIDITFGYKMSGPAAVGAKNVMLMTSATTTARSAGRRQLFTQPHPARRGTVMKPLLVEVAHLQELEEASAFREHASHLSPIYRGSNVKDHVRDDPFVSPVDSLEKNKLKIPIDLNYLLEYIEVDDDSSVGYQELLLWMQKFSDSSMFSENIADDIFSVGCILAELHLRRPLFDPTTLAVYLESGVLPRLMHELPPHTEVLVAACIQRDWKRRPSAKNLLESPYFPTSVRSSYLFVAPLQLLSKEGTRLRYAANFANIGALKAMGEFAAEMCVPYCLPLMLASLSDDEAEWAYIILKEFLKFLNPKAVKTLILPAIQKILQATGYSHLKVSLLQGSFVQDLWNRIGKQAYLEKIHPVVLSNLYVSPHRSSSSAASVLLIGSSEELGVPITVHQTILPLIQCFGKGLCSDGIDVVVRIGGLFGESFVVKQILPLLRNVISSCNDNSYANKPEPMQTWSTLSLMDCLTALDGVVGILSKDVIVKELIEEGGCLYIQILMQFKTGIPALQVAATSLIAICQLVGPELTAVRVLPKLKGLFDEFAFSQDSPNSSDSLRETQEASKPEVDEETQMGSRTDLVLLLYPSLASIVGIEKLRQSCATWLLLEQFLLRRYNWKWEYTVESSRGCAERRNFNNISTSEYNPAKLLFNGFGWSIPQSQGIRVTRNLTPGKTVNENPHDNQVERHMLSSPNIENQEPWYWFSSPSSDRIGFLSRVTGLKDELPWKIKASVMHSVRAHHGALRSFAVRQDESTFFTAGVGPGFKGTVQKWDLSAVNILSGYHGHDEVVNDICVLPSTERVASCDGTVHVWNSENGKLISVFAEYSANSGHQGHSSNSTSRINGDQSNSMLNINPISSGILTTAFDESLYTSMHHLENTDMLVVGTGNGSLRFIDVNQGRKLHLWRSELVESNFPSLISSICSCGSDDKQADGGAGSPSWVAAALSSGVCRLLDVRTGSIISSWQAHDGYVTKLAAAEDHLLVSSSLDKTLKIWDLRRSWATDPVVYRGHNDSVSGFSVWGQDVISISRNKIGVSSLSRSADLDEQHRITPQYLYMADKELRHLSTLSSITILPFSRLFLVGTVDGYLKICC